MNEIKTFRYLSHDIRTFWDEDQFFFVAQDVCGALGLSNASVMCQKLPTKEIIRRQLVVSGQRRYMLCVTTTGLFSVVNKVKQRNTEHFLNWISQHILSSIKGLETHAPGEAAKSLKVNQSAPVSLGRCDIHFNIDMSSPPCTESLAVLERITGIDLSDCLTDK